NSPKKPAIFSLRWSTWPATSAQIRKPRCAAPMPSSSAASPISNVRSRRRGALLRTRRWKRWTHCGMKRRVPAGWRQGRRPRPGAVRASVTAAAPILMVRRRGRAVLTWLPAANDEPRPAVIAAVSAIVVAGASVVVVAPAWDVAGIVEIAKDIARSPGPPAASIILVAEQTDLVDVGGFGGADRRRVEGRGGGGGREQRSTECAHCDGLHGVLPSVGRETRSL